MQEISVSSSLDDGIDDILGMEWAQNLLTNIQNVFKKFTLQWFQILLKIDSNEQRNKPYVQEFSKKLNDFYEKTITDMSALHDAYVHNIHKVSEKLHFLENELEIENSSIDEKLREGFLKELEAELKMKVNDYEHVLQMKHQETEDLNKKYRNFANRLGILAKQLPANPKKCQMESFKQEICNLESEITNRENKVLKIKRELNEIAEITGIQLELKFFELSKTSLKITDTDIEYLVELHNEMVTYKKNISTEVDILKSDLENLWKILDYSSEYKEKILADIGTIDLQSFCYKLKSEIKTLKMVLKDRMQKNRKKQVEGLNDIWSLCYCGSDIKNSLPIDINSDSDETSQENLLELSNNDFFNEELEKWEYYYAENKKIFDTFKNYLQLIETLLELEQNKDCNEWFKNRGGTLLTELQRRRLLLSKIQTTENKLLKLSQNYSEINQKPILVFDEPLDDYVNKKIQETSALRRCVSPRLSSMHRPVQSQVLNTQKAKPKLKFPDTPTKGKSKPNEHIKRKKISRSNSFYINEGTKGDDVQNYSAFKKNIKVRSSSFHEEAQKNSQSPSQQLF